ncbi:MAG: response regulator [Nitrospirae bacterium]|nr:response regulator [Nitrospirota bacterium]
MEEKAKILVVEDEAIIARDLQWRLQRMGYDAPFAVATGKDALDKTMEYKPDLILMDIMLRGQIDGIETTERIHASRDVPVIYLTAYADDEILERAKVTEPFGYLIKPIEDRELHSAIEITLYKHRLEKKLREEISERKRSEARLIKAEQEWEDTFNTITDMITIHDKDFNIIMANKAAQKILGLPEAGEAKCFRFYHGVGAPPDGCPSCKCLKTEKPAAFETFEPHLNMFVEIRAIPRFDADNRLAGLIHVVRDITDRKMIEEAITRAKTELETLFNNATEFIILTDKDFRITRCNKSFAEFVRKPEQDIIGSKCTDYIPFDPKRPERENVTAKIEINTESGRWLYISFCPLMDEKGEFLHAIIIATDITDLKNIQQRLQTSESELKTRVEELENFYEMAVGRELRIKELKSQITKLNKKLKNKEDAVIKESKEA